MAPIEIYAIVVTLCAVGLIFVAAVLAGKAFHRDTRVEKKLEARALALAETLARKGFTLEPPLIRDAVLGDWDKFDHDMEHAERVIADKEKFRLDLNRVRDTLNKEELENRKYGQHFLDSIVHEAELNHLTPTGYVKKPAPPAPPTTGAAVATSAETKAA